MCDLPLSYPQYVELPTQLQFLIPGILLAQNVQSFPCTMSDILPVS